MTDIDKGYKLLEDMYRSIYTTSQKLCVEYGTTAINLTVLNQVIAKARLKDNRTDVPPTYKDMVKAYNNSLALLYKSCKDICKQTGNNAMDLPMLNLLISTMIRGITQENTDTPST